MGTNLVEDERGNAGRNERVSNPQVPCHPLFLEPVELGKIRIRARVKLWGSEVAGRANKSGVKIEWHAGGQGREDTTTT